MADIRKPDGVDVSTARPKPNVVGWTGFIVTVGILLEQIYMHGVSLVTDWIPIVFSDRLGKFLNSTNPLYSPSFRFEQMLDLVNTVCFFIYTVMVLIFLSFRKKVVPKLLVIYAAIALVVNITETVLLHIQPEALKASLDLNLLVSIIFIGINVLMILYYLLSKRFRAIFTR